ncbi:hypothetical protein DL764_010100 [Monosporascus ibericus]|uniref:Nephrocystin 3-like N-terminal domain-containing protein n=1 Tax=Monosporascus ibericus TaxID=155417 RepID=A0A4Q4SV83_9PEZI|nr:hypothetical protein DL764_010100 [Monosporascus ibericus]
MSDPIRYSVGWICAISTEFVAAQALLDETHDGPQHVTIHDNNSYVLGTVGKHNVAIAVLPDGEYGLSSAAITARDMVHSFPNIRISLMVGIGGGALSTKHDVRLGDVVEQKFQTTRILSQPPTVLRTAVGSLKAAHEIDGAQLDDIINQALLKKPRLRQKYQRQDPDNDRLYRPDFVHSIDATSCTGYCDCQPSNWVPRSTRDEYKDNPTVHYGLIASANQLMKDAYIRDKHEEEEDVLCFEMEAAGLINHFPGLVIRGICDYANSHKHKAWQRYAAMAAAANTKGLLAKIAPNKLEAEKIVDILDSRCGKTILSSTVIETLRVTGKDRIVLHFYFAFNDKTKQKLEDLIRSLVIQLGLLRDDCQKLLEDLFFTCSHGRRLPSCDELCSVWLPAD